MSLSSTGMRPPSQRRAFLLGPYTVRYRHVESVDATVQRVDKAREPRLKVRSLSRAFLHVRTQYRQLRDDDPALV